MPKDFLRIVLDQQQIKENQDKQLAHQLQYGFNEPDFYSNGQNRMINASLGRGRLQLDIVEAKLNKNYGILISKMDPYVSIKIGSKVYETHSDYGSGKFPKWNKTLMCFIPHNIDTVSLEIIDEVYEYLVLLECTGS